MCRAEIWLISFDPTVGAEIRKTCPAVIVSSDDVGNLPLKVIALLTEWKPRYEEVPWMVSVQPSAQNGLAKPSAVDALCCAGPGRSAGNRINTPVRFEDKNRYP